MSVKFSKLQEVDLRVENSEHGDRIAVIGSIHSNCDTDNGIVEIVEENDADASTNTLWKFWGKRSRYNLSTRYLQRKSCRRCKCKVNSWKAVIIALLLFSAAILISIVISRLATEPPDEGTIPEPQLNSGVLAKS